MLNYRDRKLRLSLELGDGLVGGVCLFAAAQLRCSESIASLLSLGPIEPPADLYLSVAIAGAASTSALRWAGAYATGSGRAAVLRSLTAGWAVSGLALVTLGLVFGLQTLTLSVLALAAPLHLSGLAASRLAVATWARASWRRGRNERTFLVIGSDHAARRVANRLTADWGFRNLGFLDDEPAIPDVRALGEMYLGAAKDLSRFIEHEVIDEVVVALPRQKLCTDSTAQAISMCEKVGLDVTIVSDLFQPQRASLGYHKVLGVPALNFASYDFRPLWAAAVKRAIDIAGALLGLGLTLPLSVLVAISIKLDSPGPVFFVQRRSGLHGRTFPFVKFRSMHADAERHLDKLRRYNEVTGPVFKMSDDPRVTRIGRLLRLSSIDELPQLLNVLLGHMSLVGPRPPLPDEVHEYALDQRRRLSVRPGLTCLWQISGRSLVGFDDWVRLDLEYIDRWSLLLDFSIMLRTVPAVLTGRGAS